jgi:S1-C subfamily serine protease
MTVVDWVIVAFTAMLALQGYARGFIVAVLSLMGFAAGALLGTRLGPLLLPGGAHSRYATMFGLAGALLAGGVLATGFEGIGRAARGVLRLPGFRLLDGLAGALLTAVVGLGIAWIVGAIVLLAPASRSLRQDVRRSTILRELDRLLPPSGPILGALAHIDPLPSLSQPLGQIAPPPPAIVSAPGVTAAAASVVRVIGAACGIGVEGSGWVAGPDLVVTNAHVVAGETDTTVQIGGSGAGLTASPLVFDAHNDIAVLYVPGLNEPPLQLAPAPRAGTAAATLGFPEDGPYDAQPGRLGQTQATETENAYGVGPVLRQIAALRGLVRPGNSGGPMVDAQGQVVATVFAAIANAPTGQEGGFAVPNAVVSEELATARRRTAPVSSGACAD